MSTPHDREYALILALDERAARWAREYIFDGETTVEDALQEAYLAGADDEAEHPRPAAEPPAPLVHYRWPPQCFSEIARGETWSGRLDLVTCPTCRTAGERG